MNAELSPDQLPSDSEKVLSYRGSLGKVPQKLKKIVIKSRYISDCLSIFKSTIYVNGLTVRNISSFITSFFFFQI
jgi:hypothetical protein